MKYTADPGLVNGYNVKIFLRYSIFGSNPAEMVHSKVLNF